ncbi:MAG TPA: MBL fold metallo-hydrolase [Gemmatimonadaceae bacterium]|jgi:glyoxylase-like metal-dependent hydrolase (beta-lactamase superfamily II)
MCRAATTAAALVALAAHAALAQRTVVPQSLSADSATRAALASRYPRDRSDTLPAFPLRELAPGVYAVLGDTGRGVEGRPNAGFVITSAGVVVIDALASPGEGRVLMRTIHTVTRTPVRYLVLTHHHPDHTFGAIVLKRAGARIIAHPDRRTLANIDGDDRLASDWTGVMGLEQMRGFAYADAPDIAVRHDTLLDVGGRRIEIVRPGAAHTAGDLMVWLPAERVLFAGDVLVEDGVSMMVDGSSTAMLGALARIDSLDPRVAVPGHGRLAAKPATLVARTRCYVLALRDTMRRAVADGVRMGQSLDRLPPADRDRPVSLHSRLRRNAVRVYGEMEQMLLGAPPSKEALAAEAGQLAACPR